MASQPVTDRLSGTEIHSLVGETLCLKRQPNNHKDRCAVAVKKDNVTVRHIPYNLAPTISAFLSRGASAGFVEVAGPIKVLNPRPQCSSCIAIMKVGGNN